MSYATATAQWKKTHQGEAPKEYKLFSKQLYSVKENGEDYYMTFIVASTHPDNASNETLGVVGDIITKECLESMANKWNSTNMKGSIHHKISHEIASVGQPGTAKVIPMKDGHYGLMATAKANKFLNDGKINYNFDRFRSEIEDRVLDGVSIEYVTKDYDIVNLGGSNYRMLKELELLGYGHASRPINEEAKLLNSGFKELNIEVKDMEDKEMMSEEDKKKKMSEEEKKKMMEEENMSDEDKKKMEEEKKKKMNDSKKSKKEQSEEKMSDENKEMTLTKEDMEEFKSFKEAKSKANVEAKEKELETKAKNWVEEKMKSMSPLINPGAHFDTKETKEMPSLVEYKEALKSGSLNDQWDAANRLVSDIGFARLWSRTLSKEQNDRIQSFECKGSQIVPKKMEVKELFKMKGMEFKTGLTTTANDETTYYQAAAELADIYEPVLYRQFNDATMTWGRLPKVSYSTRPRIQFVIGTARNTTAGGYDAETTETFTEGVQTRLKCEQEWATYRVVCKVSNKAIVEAQGMGGTITSDLWGQEVQDAAIDLAVKINTDLLTGAASTYNGTDVSYLLGLQHLCQTSGNLYGKARSSIAKLQGNYEAMSDANLTLDQMRKMMDTVKVNGAITGNLLFVTSFTQLRKYRQILQSMQRLEVYSQRAGFTDLLEFDGVPLMADPQADTDDLFLLDMNSTKVGIKLAPTLSELSGVDFDGKRGYIKIYFNPYVVYPNRNYWCSGFATA